MHCVGGVGEGGRRAGKRGDPPSMSDDELTAAAARAYSLGARFSEAPDRIAAHLAGLARAPREALAAVSEGELGLSLSDLLGARARPALDELAEHRDALGAA